GLGTRRAGRAPGGSDARRGWADQGDGVRDRVTRPRATRDLPARGRSAHHRPTGRERVPAGRGERDRPRCRSGTPPRVRRRIRGTRGRMSTAADAVVGPGTSERSAVAPVPRKRRYSRAVREAGLGYLLLLPAFLIVPVFTFYPFFRNFYLGFFSTPPFPGQPKNYVGLDQYKDVLTSSEFLDSLKVTVIFAVITVP